MNSQKTYYCIEPDTHDYIVTVGPVSFIESIHLCSGKICSYTFQQKTEGTTQQLGVSNEKVDSFTVLRGAEGIAYSTNCSMRILSNGSEVVLDYKGIRFMRGNESNVLAYCEERKRFIIISMGVQVSELPLPKAFFNNAILSASLSPDGHFVAFFAYDVRNEGELVILSVINGKYRAIGKRARVYDIQWSPLMNHISISGISKRDIFEISYSYKMRNCAVNDKEVLDLNGTIIWQS